MCGANDFPHKQGNALAIPRQRWVPLKPAAFAFCSLVSSQFIAGKRWGRCLREWRLRIPSRCAPRLPVVLLMMDGSLGCNICCDGSQRSMKIHKAALGCISQDFVCVCVCVVSFCSPISALSDCIELCSFDNLLFSVCFILPHPSQREIATCPLMRGRLANTPSWGPWIFALLLLGAASAACGNVWL